MVEHATRDIAFSAYLLMMGYRFLRVETKGAIKYWVFEVDDPTAREVEWINSQARSFYQSFQELKNTLGPERGGRKL